MTIVGSGSYRYELNETWAKLPNGWTFGQVSAVATDTQDRVYAFQRKDPPIIVFDRDGNYLSSWGSSAIADPHGLCIIDDVIYLTDRNDHVTPKYTLDGKPLMILGTRGQPSDTGATKDIELPPRSAGPFNKQTAAHEVRPPALKRWRMTTKASLPGSARRAGMFPPVWDMLRPCDGRLRWTMTS
jgi:hypothetical protein